MSADIGGISLQNGFVSTLTSACQLDERNAANDVAMYFMGPLCRQSQPDWVREYVDAVPRGAYVQYLRPNATENTTHISFEVASGQTLEARWYLGLACCNEQPCQSPTVLRRFEGSSHQQDGFPFPSGRTSLFCNAVTSSAFVNIQIHPSLLVFLCCRR